MADVVVDATAGGTSANSYCSLADAETYHDSHPYPDTWYDAGSGEQSRALVMATRLLDIWYDWNGDVASSSQALLWPRDGVVGPNGYEEASDAIPTRIREATAELARQLLTSDRTADSDLETQGITDLRAGPIALSFSNAMAKPIPDAVAVMVSWYGKKHDRTGSAAVELLRG